MTPLPFRPLQQPSVVFVDDWFYHSLLRAHRDQKDWVRFPLRQAKSLQPTFDPAFYRYCYEQFHLDPYHSDQLKPYVWPILSSAFSANEKLDRLRKIAHKLLADGIMLEPRAIPQGHFVELWNEPDVDWVIQTSIPTQRFFLAVAQSPIDIILTHNQDDAIRQMLQAIAKDIDEGRSIDTIKIVNARLADINRIEALCPLYGFGIAKNQITPLIKHPVGVRFWQLLETVSLSKAFQILQSEVPLSSALTMIETLALRYEGLVDVRTLIRFELEQNGIAAPRFENAVALLTTAEIDPYSMDRYHVLNALDGMLPATIQNDAYLTDVEKTIIGLKSSMAENERRRRHIRFVLDATTNLTLYQPKQMDGKETIPIDFPASRQTRLFPASKTVVWDRSRSDLRLLAAKHRYTTKTYGMIHADQAAIVHSLGEQPRVFDAQYRLISEATNRRLLGSSIRLSATSLETFFHCRFHYLLQSLLKIEGYQPSLPAAIGNAVHKHLEQTFADKSPQGVALESLPDYSPKRLNVFELAISKRMEDVVMRFFEHLETSRFEDKAQESTWSHPLPTDARFSLYGKIDRILFYRSETEESIVVIDYKTGSTKFDPIAFERGTDIQLIVYLDLIRQGNSVDNLSIAGFFYQPIPLSRLKRETNGNPLAKAMKMNGYIRRDEVLAKAFDAGGFVKSLKYKTDGGFNKTAKTFDEAELSGYFSTLERLLASAIAAIGQGQYHISPLPLEKNQRVSSSCEYCPFQGVCYLANKITEDESDIAEESEDTDAWED
jgi:hypothetical protein